MKPRNKFEQAVITQSRHLHPIIKSQTQWALRDCIDHYAYRLPKGKTTCMDCGHSWKMDIPSRHCTCPQYGAGLQIKETYQRKLQQKQYFTILTTSGGYQVVSLVIEIGQYWWSESGRQTIVAVQRIMGHYVDSFAYYSPMAVRNDNEAYRFIAHCSLYPKVKAIDTLNRNGFVGECHDIAPNILIPALLTDSRIETLMKAGRTKHLRYFLYKAKNSRSIGKPIKSPFAGVTTSQTLPFGATMWICLGG